MRSLCRCKGSDDMKPHFNTHCYVFQLSNILHFCSVFQVVLDVSTFIVQLENQGIYPGYFAVVILCTNLGLKEKLSFNRTSIFSLRYVSFQPFLFLTGL